MQDVQGQTYWQWCRKQDFRSVTDHAQWDSGQQALSLTSRLGAAPPGVPPAQTRAAASEPPIAMDSYGGWARVDTQDGLEHVVAGGAVDPEAIIFTAPADTQITDLTSTGQDWLVILLSTGAVVVRDLLDRFAQTTLSEVGFTPDRVLSDGEDVVWLLDRSSRRVRRVVGNPVPERVLQRSRADYVFQPDPIESDPLRLESPELPLLDSADEEFIDAVAVPDGRLFILGLAAGRQTTLRYTNGRTLSARIEVTSLQSAFSITRYDRHRLAFRVPGSATAVAVDMPGITTDSTTGTTADTVPGAPLSIAPIGLILPLRHSVEGRFCHCCSGVPPHYPSQRSRSRNGGPPMPVSRLVALSRPSYAKAAAVRLPIIDAEQEPFIWHRLYIEAHLPQDCGLTLHVAAGSDKDALDRLPRHAMHAHHFGVVQQKVNRQLSNPDDSGTTPQGVWLDLDSERPWLASATGREREVNRCGLFSVLVQKSSGAVRRIQGRYVRIDIELCGSGQATPRVYAVRLWGSRNGWRDRYLPDHLSTDTGEYSAGSDFMDRYLSLFESVLTPLEDQIAHSYRLTRPDTAPADILGWLADWIGADLDAALPDTAKRQLLEQAVGLWRRRGTLPALQRMLDIVTEGGIRRGDLVVLEHFQLRRTFSTLLGLDLSDDSNPLTPFARASGNSHLGGTFFLGAEDQKAFFALFKPELLNDPLTSAEERDAALTALAEFFDQHAHTVTVIVHAAFDDAARSLVSRVLEREVPAHVGVQLVDGPGSLVLALSSMVGIDTRLGGEPAKQELLLGDSQIGQIFLSDLPTLDPRFEGGA